MTRYCQVPSAVVPVCVPTGGVPFVDWRYAIASCTPDSATCTAAPQERLRAVVVAVWFCVVSMTTTSADTTNMTRSIATIAKPSSPRSRSWRTVMTVEVFVCWFMTSPGFAG